MDNTELLTVFNRIRSKFQEIEILIYFTPDELANLTGITGLQQDFESVITKLNEF